MARPKKLIGTCRDGFFNFRVSPELSDAVTVLGFITGKSSTEIVKLAVEEHVAKFKDQIEVVQKARREVLSTNSLGGEQ